MLFSFTVGRDLSEPVLVKLKPRRLWRITLVDLRNYESIVVPPLVERSEFNARFRAFRLAGIEAEYAEHYQVFVECLGQVEEQANE
jgi:hypothetical protein